MYHVLRTIADGATLIDQPTAGRIVDTFGDYIAALAAAKELRVERYRHKLTGEVRELTALQVDGCAYHEDQSVWEWVRAAEWFETLGYALVVEPESLPHFEPTR